MNRRNTRLIRSDLQFKVVCITLFVATFVLLINLQLLLASLWTLSANAVEGGAADRLLGDVRGAVISRFVISLAVAIPLSLSVGILYTFRFGGPIHHLKQHLLALQHGRWDTPLRLRRGDRLADLSTALNDTMSEVCQRLRSNLAVLREVRSALETVDPADAGTRESLEGLTERLRAEEQASLARLGELAEEPEPERDLSPV